MSLSDAIGELFIKVRPDTTTFGAETAAGVGAQGGAATAGGSKLGKKVGLAMGVAAGAALAKGIGDFTGFERGMNEVFTLIPDAGQEMFDSLESQTKSFAKEFGVLPDEVIKPLYDSISAGVPTDNVFSFLEDANKFAKAGAVDLNVAVDALTTGVNAFGLGAEGAGLVSDSLFTAVKLGKTTVDELASSLFQVAPIASSFGVSVEDVSAAFATLTAQGTPTKVAATQMKSAISELGKEGTKASDMFKELSGKSFTEFIAEGGNLVDVAGIMSQGADDLGLSLVDMFGSIEAGQAFVGLAADLDKSAANLAAVQDGAGATQEAFEQMEQGIGPALDKLKATLAVAFLEIGDAIAPVIMAILPPLGEFLSLIASLPGPVLAGGLAFIALAGGFLVLAGPILKAIKLFALVGKAFAAMTALLAANPVVLIALAIAGAAFLIYKNWGTISEFFSGLWDVVRDVFSSAMEFIGGVVQGGLDFIETITRPWVVVYTEIFSFAFNAISTFLETWAGRLQALFSNLFQWMTTAFQAAWAVISAIFQTAWDVISAIVSTGTSIVTGLLDTLLGPIGGIGGALETMKGVFQTVWDGVKGIMQDAYDFVKRLAKQIGDAVSDALGPVGAIAGAAGGVLSGGARLLGFDDGGVVPGPKGSPQVILAHGGETILPTHKNPGAGAAGVSIQVNMGGVSLSSNMDVVETGRSLAREAARELQAQGYGGR